MSAETGRHRRLEIAHVLFVDIVGYSKLLLNEQSEILDELNEVIRSAEQVRLAQDAGALLRLPTGDGVALIFRGSPEAPAQCALEIARALKNHPKLQLRMGIHSGPVNEVTSADDRANIAGAGINIAQRVMDCGDAGHILLSKRVAQDLESHERWRCYLHDLGEVRVKHDVAVHVVNLYTDDLGNPQVLAKIQRERDAKAVVARRARAKRRNPLIFGSLIAIVAIGLGLFLLRDRLLRRPIETQMDAKGIAVLPFENFSDDKENAFFADGIQDDILTSLARIKDLRVISRTSVMGYRGAAVHSLREIGQALGIANILEGSVRREGNRVVVTVQLIDALKDRHLWANRYDRTLADSLGLQGELALRLQPNLAEAHLALGQCDYWIDQDYERALVEFGTAAVLAPSDGEVGQLIASIERRQGKWEESLETFAKNQKLDPQNPNIVRNLLFTNTALRRWPEASRWAAQMRTMAPASLVAKIQSGYVEFCWKGDTGPLKAILGEVAAADPGGEITSCRCDVAMSDRALAAARVVEKELAIPLVERLLKTPGAVDSVDYSITVNDLKHRWEWDPIRSDPRFQKLLTGTP